MKRSTGRLKLIFVIAFVIAGVALLANNEKVSQRVMAFSEGPPPGFTGAPGEQTCTSCHFGPLTGGTFTIMQVPPNYTPGQTYQIVVRHVNSNTSQHRWGFQMTALA